ncbi:MULTISPECIES: hypothetical protein [unclassified Bradyrhizobium]|uniref:hypothetical protein n=1 Tax=unclassified Bradyrhizobium TaxID=2631580 RepID=UPI001FFAEF5A|nr:MULTISPECIES: hypothetical protein [unclassified Bradyrhizobium]MCK1302750.1 hypothetical protein [Bradyrhizobium sp. 37]MCK1770895.1 hypothetical protein [Bradyrhizobium sp. 134]
MTSIMFSCPTTDQNVQQWIEGDLNAASDAFMLVRCPACGKTHFINRMTHCLLGQENEPQSE